MAAYRRRVVCLLLSTLLFVAVSVCQGDGNFQSKKLFDDQPGRGKKDIPVGDGLGHQQSFRNMGVMESAGGAGQNSKLGGTGNLANKFRPVPDENLAGDKFGRHAGMDNQGGMMFQRGARSRMGGNPNNPDLHNPVDVNQIGRVDDAPKHRPSKIKLSKTEECAEDVLKFCSQGVKDNNFAILDCLQSDERTNNEVTEKCQHFLWQYKRNLTKDDRFDTASGEMCSAELSKIGECNRLPHGKGLIIPCLIENFENITTPSCQKFLNKMASIIFSDYRYIYHFHETCEPDISKFECGRLHLEEDDSPHSQGRTVACLAEHLEKLTKSCKKQVLRVYELQSDDYHMDRPLFYACHDDREKLCEEVKSGNGAVFQCLFDHLGKPDLSLECREKLELRQRLMSEDVRVEHTFYSKCLKDIEKHQCLGGSTGQEDAKRAHVLLCLENAHMSGEESKVDPSCVQEMIKVRERLLEDYQINPDLMVMCSDEIEHQCKGLEPGGNTLHCLMGLARSQARKPKKHLIRDECRAQLARLLKETNVAEDYRLDKPLQIACGDVVTAVCSHIRPGGGSIINCLMDNIDEDEMTDECEERLLEIQFFVARDFRMDPDLYKSCKRDVRIYCHESGNWADPDRTDPDQGPLVLACLRRHYFHHGEDPNVPQLSRACIFAVQRVMRRRSQSVDLHPEIEEACVTDLGDKCSEDREDVEKGAELECLQTHYELLEAKCKAAIEKFTEEESEDIQMDAILMKSCTPMIKKFCEDEMENDAEADDVLECLIEHKNHVDMQPKCAAGIEHHQLISMQDFRFSHKFKEACQKSAKNLCKSKTTKYEVVSCLSEHVRNDTLLDKKHRVEPACRRQLKVELLQRGESIKLDPELHKMCSADVKSLCSNISPGNAAVLECLKKHKEDLSKDCHKLLFKREEEAFAIADYALVHTCKKMIRQHCDPALTEPEIFDCLKKNKDDDEFDDKCRRIVIQRQITQSRDYRLNPLLQKSCQQDIPKFCSDVIVKNSNDGKLEGKVINCLKQQFPIKRLSSSCAHQIRDRIKAASTDIRMAPVLLKACRAEITRLCKQDLLADHGDGIESMHIAEAGQGRIIECLKTQLSERKIEDVVCRREVANLLAENHVDVNVDPLLHTACQQDLITLCRSVSAGQGRQMSCLLSFLDEDPRAMTTHCREMLRKRKEMWEYAAQVAPPESFGEIYDSIASSPSKNYFMVVLFTVVAIIFIVGISCGRVTKRVRAEIKNKYPASKQ
ncbi:Golgi apparatus protein 1-like isoform X2 [Babylonia areolata]|uniref:Golgi apparatus protein 1-like isoform X2 n=1 Tax=Babylonia areolata TaxID=304850 RepID=UPI003FCFE9F0